MSRTSKLGLLGATLILLIGCRVYFWAHQKPSESAIPAKTKLTNTIAASAPIRIASSAPKSAFLTYKEKSLAYTDMRINDLKAEKLCIEKTKNFEELKECTALVRQNMKKTIAELSQHKQLKD